MFKHKSTHRESVITVTDDDGNHITFTPGKVIVLNRVYKELEAYGIVCTNPDEQKPKPVKKTGKKIEEEEYEEMI